MISGRQPIKVMHGPNSESARHYFLTRSHQIKIRNKKVSPGSEKQWIKGMNQPSNFSSKLKRILAVQFPSQITNFRHSVSHRWGPNAFCPDRFSPSWVYAQKIQNDGRAWRVL